MAVLLQSAKFRFETLQHRGSNFGHFCVRPVSGDLRYRRIRLRRSRFSPGKIIDEWETSVVSGTPRQPTLPTRERIHFHLCLPNFARLNFAAEGVVIIAEAAGDTPPPTTREVRRIRGGGESEAQVRSRPENMHCFALKSFHGRPPPTDHSESVHGVTLGYTLARGASSDIRVCLK
jgi:hypothetical protein